ncbi:NAD(+) synthase [Sporanaerobacter acetigenes]|uniref:NH(3)-dependent NAD(+) synthetase n=1 Tax=Sporanaerobacter acetigenes DSM 13106 TaxID=1123281 RepID=A0A1M5UKP7_9FIRM|nr:NAD(+) synthase [Sporanaerobacter acetigenes]SHH63537.1 NAD+ synthase [Sporanaerobacter acetigenes DSM 13106]
MENVEKICDEIVKWIKERVEESGSKGVVFGLSGGIDSAVVAGLSKRAFPEDSLGIIMPCHSNPIDEKHGILVAESLSLKTIKVDLTDTYDVFMKTLIDSGENKLAKANVKPRLRMTTLYYFAQLNNYLVVGPSNKSELTVGYFTKHGDSGVDILPIASFVKSEVREMAKFLNIPEIIITKAPTAGLWEDQTDEREMGFGYDVLDNYIKTGRAEDELKEKIERLNKRSEHKRKYPPIFKF